MTEQGHKFALLDWGSQEEDHYNPEPLQLEDEEGDDQEDEGQDDTESTTKKVDPVDNDDEEEGEDEILGLA